jgi:hypothetical protein
MIDKQKTEFLRKKIQLEKNESETGETKGSSALAFLLYFIARYFAFYGAQWLILNKFETTPFNLLETIIIYFAIIGIFANKK